VPLDAPLLLQCVAVARALKATRTQKEAREIIFGKEPVAFHSRFLKDQNPGMKEKPGLGKASMPMCCYW